MATLFSFSGGYVLTSASSSGASIISLSATSTQYVVAFGMGNLSNDGSSKYTTLVLNNGSGTFYNPPSSASGPVTILTFSQPSVNNL